MQLVSTGPRQTAAPSSGHKVRRMEYIILSNNSSLGAEAHGLAVKRVTGDLQAMYDTVSEHLQNGYTLVSSPLPANVPLIRSPVRSVILGKAARRYDAQGLLTLEKARDRTGVLGVVDDERTRADLEFIDKDQLARAVAQLKDLGPA